MTDDFKRALNRTVAQIHGDDPAGCHGDAGGQDCARCHPPTQPEQQHWCCDGYARSCVLCGYDPEPPTCCGHPVTDDNKQAVVTARLHAERRYPGFEYATTRGPRKQWDDADRPPAGENSDPDYTWERNVDAGRRGWDRFDYHEESYWRRPRPAPGPVAAGGETQADGETGEACLFCRPDSPDNQVMVENGTCYARFDNYPAARGHLEIVPRRHVESVFDLTAVEISDVHALLADVRRALDTAHHPDGYTIGINEGRAAGRTVDHLHIHVIPRHFGDVPDPRGGIRRTLPNGDPDQWAAPPAPVDEFGHPGDCPGCTAPGCGPGGGSDGGLREALTEALAEWADLSDIANAIAPAVEAHYAVRDEELETRAEQAEERAYLAELELRVLRSGLRANGADPTQIQNLWAQIRMRNRQWREEKTRAKRAEAEARRLGLMVDEYGTGAGALADKLTEAREMNRRLNLRAQQAETRLAAIQAATADWQLTDAGTYVPLRSITAIAKACAVPFDPDRFEPHIERVHRLEAVIARVRTLADDLGADALKATGGHGDGLNDAADRIHRALDPEGT